MKKRIIAFATGTVAVLALAIGYQTVGAADNAEQKQPTPATSTEGPAATPSDGATTQPSDGTAEEDEGTREGATEDHSGKPGENK